MLEGENMDERNRKIIAIIAFIRKFIIVFFDLFFNIYVLKISKDFTLIVKMSLFGSICSFIFTVIVLKVLNKHNSKYVYKFSFVLLVLCIGLLIFLKKDIVKYIYLFKMLYGLVESLYYGPYEVLIMGSNNHKTFSTFQANLNILMCISTILTPIFSGFIIEKFSYGMLFIILIIEAIIILITATKIKDYYVADHKTNITEFWNKAKKYKHMKDIYKCMFFRRISSQGVVLELLPIILFLKLNSELSLGTYNSLFAILTIISMSILKIVNKKNCSKNFYVPFSILIFISTLLLVFFPGYSTLLIYYIFMNSLGSIIESESCSCVYEAINVPELSKYNREHDIVFNIYMIVGKTISYVLAYILYTNFYSKNVLSILVAILMFFLIISCIYLKKVQKYLEKNSK